MVTLFIVKEGGEGRWRIGTLPL
uniref:Uncharacterized protein n=1 Tax=Rhizophora mucronata TaxID=61149 RepID=A0A2P2QKH3_RHIMU